MSEQNNGKLGSIEPFDERAAEGIPASLNQVRHEDHTH